MSSYFSAKISVTLNIPVDSPSTTAAFSHCRKTQGEPVKSSAVRAWSSSKMGIPALAAAVTARAALAARAEFPVKKSSIFEVPVS